MQEKRRKYSPEFKVEAARLVVESARPIVEVAREIGVHEGTLGSWVSKYRAEHAGDEPPLSLSERARLRELEREVHCCSRGIFYDPHRGQRRRAFLRLAGQPRRGQ